MTRLVLVGGGHANIEVLRRFGLKREPDTEITLINTSRHTVYSRMLPGLVAGHYGWRACFIDLEVLARFAGARLLRDIAVGLDLERKLVRCADAAEVPYDIASVDVGSAPSAPAFPHPDSRPMSVRPVQRFISTWDGLVHEAGDRELTLQVVGATTAAIELCLSMQHRLLRRVPQNRVKFGVIAPTADILPDHNAGVRRRVTRILRGRGVAIRTARRVLRVASKDLILEGDEVVPADHVLWATGPSAPRWLGEIGLRTNDEGFVLIDDKLRALSHPDIFAAGDVATMVDHQQPSELSAVHQGPSLAANLRLALRGDTPRAFEPPSSLLQLITTGDQNAIASWGPLHAEGHWVWNWKDRIDRSFIRRYAVR